MSLNTEGITLFETARAKSVPFSREVEPRNKEVTVNGLKIHYLDWGGEGKQPILLLHGALQQGHSWDLVALSLCADYHVLVPDARGHGESQWAPDGDYSVEAHVRDLDGLLKALGLDQILLVGHSMGGKHAYVFTSLNPDRVKALVIVDVGPEVRPQGVARIERFRELPAELSSYLEFAERVQEYTGRPLNQVLGSLKYSIRQMPNGKWTWKHDKLFRAPGYQVETWPEKKMWDCLASLQCPTLIIRGEESDIFSSEVMEKMLTVISQSDFAVVPRAGHLVPGDNPADFLNSLRPWLAGI